MSFLIVSLLTHIYACGFINVYNILKMRFRFIWICIYFLQFLRNALADIFILYVLETLKQIKMICIESILCALSFSIVYNI